MPEVTGLGRASRVREMAAEDLEAVARLEGELFGAEAWSRDLLAAELKASHGPRADAATSSSSPMLPITLRIVTAGSDWTGRGSWATPVSITPAACPARTC